MRTLIALMLFATTPVAAGAWEDGQAAFEAGDYQKADRLWKPLAEQGDAWAQTLLGSMYANGGGVPKDYVLAYAWSSIAAARGNAHGIKVQELLTKIFTPAQIAKGQKLSRDLWEKYVVPFQKK